MIFEKNHHIGHIIYDCFKLRPNAICQIDAATGEEETNGSVLRRSVQLARCFRRLGLQTSDVLALSGRNHLHLHIPYYAAAMNGLPVAGFDALLKFGEIKDMFRVVEPKISFCEPESYEDHVNSAKELGLDTRVVTFGEGEHSMQELLDTYKDNTPIEEFEVAAFDPEKVYALLVSTGGTTGLLKVAAFTHDAWKQKMSSILFSIFETSSKESDQPNAPGLNLSSIHWISGMFNAIGMPVLRQTKIQTSAGALTTEHIIDIINKYRPLTTMLGPTTVTSILKNEKPCDLTCFKSIVLAGGKVYKDIVLLLKERVSKDTLIIEAYGQTENLGPIFAPNPFGPIGNCGTPIPTVQTKLVDPETGKDVTEPYAVGELWTKTVGFSCYYNNPEETASAFTEGGWFKTGDLLYRDENNNHFFVERLKMLIKYRNYQIIPPELEAVIRSHAGVLDASVTSVPHARDQEHPVACVLRRPGAAAPVTAHEIKALVADKLSETKQLRGGVVFLDEFPLTPAGKVARGKLRQLVLNMHRE